MNNYTVFNVGIVTASVIFMLFIPQGCSKNDDYFLSEYGDTLVYYDSHMQIYVCEHEWSGIVLNEKDPNKVVANTKWHVPTYTEAVLVRSCRFGKECGTQRYLCYDTDFGVWYSYKMNNEGNVTKAGNKTKYAIRPVRVVKVPADTIVYL